jgi:hypothetical protein
MNDRIQPAPAAPTLDQQDVTELLVHARVAYEQLVLSVEALRATVEKTRLAMNALREAHGLPTVSRR